LTFPFIEPGVVADGSVCHGLCRAQPAPSRPAAKRNVGWKKEEMTTKTKYFIVGGLCLLAGAAFGAIACLTLLIGPKKFFNDIGQVHMMSQYAHNQSAQAGFPHSRDALQEYIKYLDNYRVEKNSWLSEDVLVNEKLMTYARIALLDEEHGQPGEADAAWAKAEGLAGRSNWKAKDRAAMRAFVQRVDQGLK